MLNFLLFIFSCFVHELPCNGSGEDSRITTRHLSFCSGNEISSTRLTSSSQSFVSYSEIIFNMFTFSMSSKSADESSTCSTSLGSCLLTFFFFLPFPFSQPSQPQGILRFYARRTLQCKRNDHAKKREAKTKKHTTTRSLLPSLLSSPLPLPRALIYPRSNDITLRHRTLPSLYLPILLRTQPPLVDPPELVQCQTRDSQTQHRHQIPSAQRFCLEDTLHERDVDETELGEEGDGAGEEEHPVLKESTAESSVLDGGGEVEEDEGCESLRKEKAIQETRGWKRSAWGSKRRKEAKKARNARA